MSELDSFLAARDGLLARRTDLAAATENFQWPALKHFNWAIDYFDAIARNNDKPALHIVEETGEQARLSYSELSKRSSQVANFLRGLGAKPGDRILLMLGNEVPLWETMLAAIKIGAVVIPATTLLSESSGCVRAGRAARCHRAAARILHLGHHLQAQARSPLTPELSGGPSVHALLAGPAAR